MASHQPTLSEEITEDAVPAEEVERILEEAKELKHVAVDYLHPELPVVTEDPLLCCTNYFDRPSAPIVTDEEEAEEERILEELKELKHLAVDYLHPELPVVTEDPLLCTTNYFDRPSAPLITTDPEEEAQILEDAKELKHKAVDYLHPELPVVTEDPLLCTTNYFDRPSAPLITTDPEEEAQILEDAKELKHKAVDYLHPELPVVTEDPLLCTTNYFDRPSAPLITTDPEEEARILEDAKELKHKAVDYLHPELPVVTEDPLLCTTNYFDRPSAPLITTDPEEEAQILKDAKELKHKAVDYLHPELPVVTEDPLLCTTNYFDRPSAPLISAEEAAAPIVSGAE